MRCRKFSLPLDVKPQASMNALARSLSCVPCLHFSASPQTAIDSCFGVRLDSVCSEVHMCVSRKVRVMTRGRRTKTRRDTQTHAERHRHAQTHRDTHEKQTKSLTHRSRAHEHPQQRNSTLHNRGFPAHSITVFLRCKATRLVERMSNFCNRALSCVSFVGSSTAAVDVALLRYLLGPPLFFFFATKR